MIAVFLLLYLLAGIFFGLAAGGVVARRINFMALGLLCWVLVPLIQTFMRV